MSKKQITFSPNDWFDSMYRHLKKSPMAPRDCAYCFDRFTPKRHQDRDAKFCKKDCREAFYRYGGLPMRVLLRPLESQMIALVKRSIRKTVEEVLAQKLRESTDVADQGGEETVTPTAAKRVRRTNRQILIDKAERANRKAVIAELRKGRPLTVAEMAHQSGFDADELHSAVSILVTNGSVIRHGGEHGKYTYALAEEKTEAAS